MRTHKNISTFQSALRKLKKGTSIGDYVRIAGVEYRMDMYDMSGREIGYVATTNNDDNITVTTKDRYTYGYRDAIVEQYTN